MSLQQRLVQAGLSANQAAAVQGTVAGALVATGATQATALPLGADNNAFATVGAGTGAILPPMNPGDDVTVYNGGANALLIYPPVGAQIKGLGVNVGYSLAVATPLCYVVCITPTLYVASQAA
jgi:hypothetical protein